MVAKRGGNAISNPGSDEHYRARQDMHTLKEHAEIKNDPKRHAAAVAAAKAEQACLSKIDKRVKK